MVAHAIESATQLPVSVVLLYLLGAFMFALLLAWAVVRWLKQDEDESEPYQPLRCRIVSGAESQRQHAVVHGKDVA